MAYLLGSEACMESLRTDVQDLQWAITDIFSRTGPVQYPSWRYPDKTSCDLDIDSLLETYGDCDEEEEKQVAHIGLYELVIDRMVLLIQSMANYTEQLIAAAKTKGDNSASSSSSRSVGLVVKKYWNRLLHLHTVIQQTQSENKGKTRKISDLENTLKKMSEEVYQYRNGYVNPYQKRSTPPKTPGFGGLIPPNNFDLCHVRIGSTKDHNEDEGISKDACNKSSQTIETAFVPCESCDIVQKGLREAGEVIVDVCQSQSLPSSLKKFRIQVADIDWLSSNDVTRWTVEQSKDIMRINKHLENLAAKMKPLEAELDAWEKESKRLENKLSKCEKDLQLEKKTTSAIRHQYELKMADQESKHSETVAALNSEKNSLVGTNLDQEKSLEKLKEQLAFQESKLKDLEKTRNELEKDLQENRVANDEIGRLTNEVKTLRSQLTEANMKIEKSVKELSREQAKNKSVSKHGQSLQSKQDSLLQRIDDLDQENVDLRDQVAALEEEKENTEELIQTNQQKVTELKKQIRESQIIILKVNTEKEGLQENIKEADERIHGLEEKLKESQERERLIVEFPDLNGPVNSDYHGTGNIVKDMENQVKANNVRIQILEEENEGLRNSIKKLLAMQHLQSPPVEQKQLQPSGPTPLWNTESLGQYRHQDSVRLEGKLYQDKWFLEKNRTNNSSSHLSSEKCSPPKTAIVPKEKIFMQESEGKTKTEDTFLVGKSTRPNSASRHKENSKQGRPLSAKSGSTMVPVNATSISAYIQMKKSGHLGLRNQPSSKDAGRPPSGKRRTEAWTREANHDSSPIMHVCSMCDKMYTSFKDLEIHKMYCTQT